MSPVSIEQVVACPLLPTLPSVAVEVLALAAKPQTRLEDIVRVVQHDQALAARILKTVNSSFYGLAKPCPTISRAVAYLGVNTVKLLVLGFSLVESSAVRDKGFDLIDYWRRSIYSATAARRVAAACKSLDPEEAFVTALMQDIGMQAIHAAIPVIYAQILQRTQGQHDRLIAEERHTLGYDHAEVGARLAERWRLPAEMACVIRAHHCPQDAVEHVERVRAVALGAMAAATLSTEDQGESLAKFLQLSLEWFNIQQQAAQQILEDVASDASKLSQLLHVNTGEMPDVRAILAQADEAELQHQAMVQREADVLRQRNDALARIALTDALTGLGNRQHFDSELIRLFNHARETGANLGLVMIDADNFKAINDTCGHQAGDEVLMTLGHQIRDRAVAGHPNAVVCRYGGEEFALILPGADRRAAAKLAESIRLTVAGGNLAINSAHGQTVPIQVSVSIGVAALEPSITDRLSLPLMLLRAADKALYAAKSCGRNCVRVFNLQPQPAVV